MIVGISVFELHLPAVGSLKEKRRIVKPLVERLHQRFRVSIMESDYHDLHQRTEIAIAAVHQSEAQMNRLMESLRTVIDESDEVQLLFWEPQLLDARP
jgi:uncharacterized protein YlxP (DUF503 family)